MSDEILINATLSTSYANNIKVPAFEIEALFGSYGDDVE
jgi:hypothetical protein